MDSKSFNKWQGRPYNKEEYARRKPDRKREETGKIITSGVTVIEPYSSSYDNGNMSAKLWKLGFLEEIYSEEN